MARMSLQFHMAALKSEIMLGGFGNINKYSQTLDIRHNIQEVLCRNQQGLYRGHVGNTWPRALE